jgi:hypothetical protein
LKSTLDTRDISVFIDERKFVADPIAEPTRNLEALHRNVIEDKVTYS